MSLIHRPKVFLYSFLLLGIFSFAGFDGDKSTTTCPGPETKVALADSCSHPSVYDNLMLSRSGLCREAFDYAVRGLEVLRAAGKVKNSNIISIVDFSQNSCKKRLFIIDLAKQKLLFNTFVAHGRNSGREQATSFSNTAESFKSSLGFYVTAETYNGEHGYSLRLQGEESGINDNALARGIVMHSAAYVNEGLARHQGFIGRSLGCPALPEELHKGIIEKIKNGTCLFLYSPDKFYVQHSRLIRQVS